VKLATDGQAASFTLPLIQWRHPKHTSPPSVVAPLQFPKSVVFEVPSDVLSHASQIRIPLLL
jgi:hypothetical protein